MRLAVLRHLHVLDGRDAAVLYHNTIDPAPPWIAASAPDLCILHTTFLCARWYDDFETYRRRFRWLARLDCPKIALPQDEYDHAAVLEDWLLELRTTSVYSCFGAEQRPILYPKLAHRVPFRETLTGFIDADAAAALADRLVPHSERPFDIVYRATKLPYWFGSHGQLKHRIAEAVQGRAGELGFSTDISTRFEDTVFGERWLDFLMSGRAVIGCESGSSVLDARGEIKRRIQRLLSERPDLSFEQVDARLPPGWDSYSFFAISPRHLEAVITKTAQVLVEGSYSGVLEPERHYIPMRRDFANLDEALERLRDREAVEEMTERAYRDVYLDGRNTLEDFARRLCEEPGRRARRIAVPFALARRLPAHTLPESLTRRNPVQTPGGRRILLLLTLLEGLAREPGSRRILLHARRRPREAVWDVILLRVLSRIRAAAGRIAWSLSADNASGTIVIKTHPDSRQARIQLGGSFERVVWDHSEVGEMVPLYPQSPHRAWVPLEREGRHEFRTLADGSLAREILERTLAP